MRRQVANNGDGPLTFSEGLKAPNETMWLSTG